MARPSQDAIDTFIGITGASEAVAVRKLEEHDGDLNAAVNAHFSEGDGQIAHAPSFTSHQDDFMNIDETIDVEPSVPSFPPLVKAAARDLNPFALLNSGFGKRYHDGEGASELSSHEPRVSYPKDVRVIQIEVKDGNDQPGSSGRGPVIQDVTGSTPPYGPEIREDVIVVDEDHLPSAPVDHLDHDPSNVYFGRHPGPVVTPSTNVTEYNNDIEEEMIQAAIEASKREHEESARPQYDLPDGSASSNLKGKLPTSEGDELAHAVSLSIKTAEEERALRELVGQIGEQSSNSSGEKVEDVRRVTITNGRQGFGTSNAGCKSVIEDDDPSDEEEPEDIAEEPLVRQRSRRVPSVTTDAPVLNSPSSSPLQQENNNRQPNGDVFPSEWGGISSEEHDEAVMLEAAMFGGIPEGSSYNFAYPHVLESGSDRNSNFYPRVPRSPSPTLTAQRLLREQQDDEYLAALQADREKELKAIQEEAAAREAALEREKRQEEEARKKLIEEEEFERKLATKQTSLPQEPSSDDENSVTLLIRMPDGSRYGRRFLKSDQLQFLFDYIDVGRLVKPGTYRLVRPYPRQAFTDGESASTLADLGLINKQEALFLELI